MKRDSFMRKVALLWQKLKSRGHVRREKNLRNMSRDLINVVEFDGELYYAYDRTPLIPVNMLNGGVTDALAVSRDAFVRWRIQEERR